MPADTVNISVPSGSGSDNWNAYQMMVLDKLNEIPKMREELQTIHIQIGQLVSATALHEVERKLDAIEGRVAAIERVDNKKSGGVMLWWMAASSVGALIAALAALAALWHH